MTGEADRRWSRLQAGSNGDLRWRGRFRPGEAGLDVGEGGGCAGEDARARNRGMVAGGGRSKEGGDGGASRRAELVSDRWEEEEGEMTARFHKEEKYLGVTACVRKFDVTGNVEKILRRERAFIIPSEKEFFIFL